MTSDTLTVVVADDERPARAFLAATVRTIAEAELVGEASGGAEAVALIERVRPDLALLDLHMPEIDGLAVVRLVRPDCLPLIAFVTAYDEYAVRAFELNAIDYLLKPVEPDRIRQTIVRAREQLAMHVTERTAPGRYLLRIPVRHHDDIILLPVERIIAIESDRDIVYLSSPTGEQHTLRYPLKDLEARLDPRQFIRVSRSALVRVDAVRRASPLPNGSYMLVLTNNQRVQLSRARAQVLRDVLFRI
ncbi:MAG TPA: LytTR family transcriptional regulator DNA-binding domain-containing protein [Gemmatimonadaceae bacterium]|nr:LytTR family transcriptional regulator DNA-binding domain-containing protein [Gemmatimonadaceae bacterium]